MYMCLLYNNRWEEFVTSVIQLINKKEDGVVFLLWGKPAQLRYINISFLYYYTIEFSTYVLLYHLM
jgi:uracil DNA glycosylase